MRTTNKGNYVKIGLYSLLIPVLGCQQTTTKHESDIPDGRDKDKPNFVIIYADDMGYGDASCFGATDIKTPNIDRMAGEGIKFTDFYSASPVCSPSRYALMTGRYPVRDGINGVFFPESYDGISTDEITIAEALQEVGYSTGIVGKWHLGHHYKHRPLQNGFDEYFGIPYSNDMEMVVYMKDNEVVEYNPDQHYTIQTYTTKALDFIERHQDKPFFLYVPHNMPHVPIYASPEFEGTSERGLYGDVIQEIDWSVGQILDKLEALHLAEETLVIFSSDNGPWLVMEDHGGSAGILREGKQYTFEGGMREPTVACWKGKIKPGTVYNGLAGMIDWFPTIVNLAGGSIPSDREIDGVDISGVLFGKGERPDDEFFYFNGDQLRCYRKGEWKIKLPFAGTEPARWRKAVDPHPLLLVNLREDPGETTNLAEKYPEKVKEMKARMNEFHESMGQLPPSKVLKLGADNSHYEYLRKKHEAEKKQAVKK